MLRDRLVCGIGDERLQRRLDYSERKNSLSPRHSRYARFKSPRRATLNCLTRRMPPPSMHIGNRYNLPARTNSATVAGANTRHRDADSKKPNAIFARRKGTLHECAVVAFDNSKPSNCSPAKTTANTEGHLTAGIARPIVSTTTPTMPMDPTLLLFRIVRPLLAPHSLWNISGRRKGGAIQRRRRSQRRSPTS